MSETTGVVALSGVTWALVGVGATLTVLVAALLWAWLTGRLTLDLGWGRSARPLGPLELTVDAPRDVVYDVVAAPTWATHRGSCGASSTCLNEARTWW